MIILDSSTKSLQILLAGAVTTNQLPFVASWADHAAATPAFTPGETDGSTNGTTAVTLVAAPAGSPVTQRQVKQLSVYNADTAPATVTIRLNNGGTFRVIQTATLQVGERIEYEDGSGFSVFSSAGAKKVTSAANTTDNTYISGMYMRWNSANSITVTGGACFIPSLGYIQAFHSPVVKAGISLTSSSWYHVYAFLNSGVPDIEVVSTAPASPYNGTARFKNADSSRRYIGSVRTDASSNIYNFTQNISLISYLKAFDNPPFRALSAGLATTATNVDLSAVVPLSSRLAQIRCIADTTVPARFTNSECLDPFVMGLGAGQSTVTAFSTNASQVMQYFNNGAASNGVYIDVMGYVYER